MLLLLSAVPFFERERERERLLSSSSSHLSFVDIALCAFLCAFNISSYTKRIFTIFVLRALQAFVEDEPILRPGTRELARAI